MPDKSDEEIRKSIKKYEEALPDTERNANVREDVGRIIERASQPLNHSSPKPKTPWFTTEKIDESTWAISEYGHWEEPHCYLLVGKKKAALIDTGLGVENIKEEVDKLTSLPIVAIITHAHWDHIGDADKFTEVAIHRADSRWLQHGLPIPDAKIQENFVHEQTTKPLPDSFNLQAYTTPRIKPTIALKGGETIDLGGRKLQIIHTPGHSPGSICIYEQKRGYLLTGDTLYKGTLYMNYESTDPQAFAKSIHALTKLDSVKRILPGHHALSLDTRLLAEVDRAFSQLKDKGMLVHGSGLHAFQNVQMLI